MEALRPNGTTPPPVIKAQLISPLVELKDELSAALFTYWQIAGRILHSSGVHLSDPPDEYFSLEKNFFSALFIYSYHRAGIPQSRRIIYAAINQCLRGMVTGCDNILDDEYKKTLETDLPEQGVRFRSVLDIMVSERIFFDILLEAFKENESNPSAVLRMGDAALHVLFQSGGQEASEEKGTSRILPPQDVLASVHHLKTGLLFQSPWAVPLAVDPTKNKMIDAILSALYKIGMGCQIMDDMVDLAGDLQSRRHNYVASIIYHECDSSRWEHLRALWLLNGEASEETELLLQFPEVLIKANETAGQFLKDGFNGLLAPAHQFFSDQAISFLSKRIGTDRLMASIGV